MKISKNLEKIVNEKKELFEKKKDFDDIIYEKKEKYFGKRTPMQELENNYISANLSLMITTITALKPEFILIEAPFAMYNYYLGKKFDRIENKYLSEEEKNKKKFIQEKLFERSNYRRIIRTWCSIFAK